MLFQPPERMAKRGACTVLHSIAGTNHGADVAPTPAQFCREGGLVEEIHEGWVEYEIVRGTFSSSRRRQLILMPVLRM